MSAIRESLKAAEQDILQLFDQLKDTGADPRHVSLAKTKLEEAFLWANKSTEGESFAIEGKQINEA